MARYFISAMIVMLTLSVSAQKNKFTPPEYKKISKAIDRANAPTSYHTLMERYRMHDTTLSPKEYHLLYYGYSLQPEYTASSGSPMADSLMSILRQDQVRPGQYALVITYCNAILEDSPFEMRFLDPLIYVSRMQGNNDLAARLEFKLGRIIETIFTSGDGLTEATAFHIISVSHETDMLRALGFGFSGGQRVTNGQLDFLKVEPNDYGITGMYFNTSALANAVK